MKTIMGCWALSLMICHATFSQVDTTFVYNTTTPYGTLDIRLAKSATRYYYLQQDKTFSFRESSPGVRTGTYRDMTSWDSSPYTQGNLREKNGSADNFIMNYRLLLPVNYNATYTQGYPLIVMMHGAGERGNCWDNSCFWDTRSWRPGTNTPPAPTTANHELLNNDYNLLHGGSVHLRARNLAGSLLPDDTRLPSRSFPGFVLFAQNLNGWDIGSVQDAIKLVRLISKKYNVDENRIYVHGLSNGGIGTYEMIKRAPWLFSAALPMSAPTEAGIIARGMRPVISHIPLWIFQGKLDTAPTPGRTQGYVKSFRDAGAVVRYTEYSHLGHGVWNSAYAEPDFFSWMLSKNKSNIHVFAGESAICGNSGQGVRMELANGFFAYQWERNGVIITSATASKYVATSPGTYRARFSRKKNPGPSDWNKWSDPVQITTRNLSKPVVSQRGTIVLKGLDNYSYAHLKAEGDFAHYYWYKNGVLINLPGSMDDTTRHVKFSAGDCSSGQCAGNGVYTLKVATADFCTSPASDGKYIFFNNQAPVNIPAPTSFTGTPMSDGRASLKWAHSSTLENGFEVWRRRQTGSTTFTPWTMAPIVGANTTSMVDQGLHPSSTYHYKIRAVGNAGRSNYTPSESNQYLVIVTSGDTQNPSIPQQLTAVPSGIREIKLQWQAASDNTGIKEYLIYYGSQVIATGSPVTTYKLANLPLNQNYTFTVRAKDLGNNLSAASNAASATTYVTGLFYEHTTGSFADIDLINWSIAEYEGRVNNFTLSPRTQEDYFNFQFEGFLYITQAGTYQFQITSNDGSRATLDDVIVVDNDGRHGHKTVTGQTIALSSGARLINVKYFEYDGAQTLSVRYKGPDTNNAWLAIPDAALRSGSSAPAPSMLAYSDQTENILTAELADEGEFASDVYPNPSRASDAVFIQLRESKEPTQVSLMDAMGKSYYDVTITSTIEGGQLQITPQERLSYGIYIVMVRQGNKTKKQTLLIKD